MPMACPTDFMFDYIHPNFNLQVRRFSLLRIMNVNATAQSTAPQANDSSPDRCDSTKILLSYKLQVASSPLQVPSESGLLHILYEIMELYAKNPRKWLLFVAETCGVDGRLRSLSGYEAFTEQEWNKVSTLGITMYSATPENCSRGQIDEGNLSQSIQCFYSVLYRAKDLKNFYGGRPFTHRGLRCVPPRTARQR